MKIIMKKSALEAALGVATIALGSGDDATLLTHYLFRYIAETDKVSVLAYDGKRLLVEIPVLGARVEDVTTDSAFTVVGWRLRDWISPIKDGDEQLTLTLTDNLVKASSKRSSGKMGTLNPKDWPYWDETFKEARLVRKVTSSQLMHMLSYVKSFVSDQETRSPALTATEAKNGLLNATDSVGVAVVKSELLSDIEFRIHGKDISTVLAFLGLKGSEEVELREHDRCLFFVRNDGGIFGVSKWVHPFPLIKSINMDPESESKSWFSVHTNDLTDALKFLSAFAKKDDFRVNFKFKDGHIVLSMASGSGAGEDDRQEIECVAHTGMELLKEKGRSQFTLSKSHLETVAASFANEVIKFRVELTPQNGCVAVYRTQDGGDVYLTVIAWLRD